MKTMINNIELVLIAFSLISVSGCKEKTTDDGEVVVCTASVDPGIRIEAIDKETGVAMSCGATALLQDGDYSEELENPAGTDCFDTQMLVGAYERSGTYDIKVSKEGYIDWFVNGVEVSSNVCHVNTITLQAYLEK